jgi:predicted O-methyltransferase YrrM
MRFEDAARLVEAVPAPHIPASRGRVLYDHIRRHRPENLLELGTARGGSALFMAAALEANGCGHLTSVDSSRWNWRNPTPREVIGRSGLAPWISLDKRFSTYTWFLKTELESHRDGSGAVAPEYDFVFLDGAKYWSTDGLAVVLIEKLLRPGGWLLLDDLGWTYEKHTSQGRHYEIEVAKLSEQERAQPHLRAVFDLLIRPNPAFDTFLVQDGWWGWARKSPNVGQPRAGAPARHRTVTALTSSQPHRARIPALLRRQLARAWRLPARLTRQHRDHASPA